MTHLENSQDANWFNLISKRVTVTHKQRDLSYSGTLTRIEKNTRSFILKSKDYAMTLPMDDFYLIPLETSNTAEKKPEAETPDSNKTPSQKISYQTNELSWTPQLNLIFNDGKVSVSQQALIHNGSSSTIQIQDSLLHYSRSAAPRLFKAERSSLTMNADRPDANYQDNEVSYSLSGGTLTIAPYSNTLIPLSSSESNIDKQTHVASLHTYGNNTSKIDLNFYNNLRFSLQKDGLPGEYKTFWKRGNLLIPGNIVTLNTVRANYPLNVTTNKSQDITGQLTLINASSQKLPNTQVWEATIENHSNQEQSYSVEQTSNGIMEILEGEEAVQTTTNSLVLSGTIKANSKKTITYKIALKN
jgi:hypothetical protein